jgi:hypothetical protein
MVMTYYICVSTETETSSNCRRCLAMDIRVDSYNQPLSGTPQYEMTSVALERLILTDHSFM